MPTRMNWKERRATRREDAEFRQGERKQRGDAGQLRHLEQLGFGECKEAQGLRTKLSGGAPGPIEGTLEVEE
jgi:hypothetical protein